MPRCVGLLALFSSLLGVLLFGLPGACSLSLSGDLALDDAIHIDQPTVVGSSNSLGPRVTVTCGGDGHAFVVRQTSLVLQNVVLSNCSSAAVVLLGPGASLEGTKLVSNNVTWLVTADSWPADAVGRTNMMAPQPSENTKTFNMQPPFTARTAMGGIREMIASSASAVAAVAAGMERVQAFVGAAPKGQSPLQVLLQDAVISSNTASQGLLWLRLVNSSMTNVRVTGNLGTGSSGSSSKRAAAAAELGAVAPPGPCDVGALHRAMVQVHGPAAFEVHRCRFSGNMHRSGALIRVTDGFALTSLRSSSFDSNTATALLRFEGRTWVLDTAQFFRASQYLDVLYYTEYEGSSRGAYSYAQKQHAAELARKESSSVDAFWLLSDCALTNNTAQLVGNTASNGSILDLESFIGSFDQVSVTGNVAGTLGAANTTHAGTSNSSNIRTNSSSDSSSSSSSSNNSAPACSLSAVAKLSHFESGRLRNVTLTNNTGSIALDINGFALAEPVEELLVADNAASGIRMVSTQPRYNGQGIVLSRVRVLRNALSPAAPTVGGLVLGGFDSPVGDNMPVDISNCHFVGNRPADMSEQGAAQLSLLGGGIQIQGPAQDTSDPAAQHGFLQRLDIHIKDCAIEGNAAAEGGGLWSAWPLRLSNVSISSNSATHAGGGLFLRGLRNDKLGSSGQALLQNGAAMPKVFSGDDMNFTVQLTGSQQFGGQGSAFNSQLGTIQLHPSNDGLFVIGSLNTSMGSSGNALFSGMAMQPVEAPISNRQYAFSFAASFGDDLLRQVQAVTVRVELLRCTWGQFMTINRCVRCNPLGTYSLNPTMQCQSCPAGGVCLKGLLAPSEGFFSYNPFYLSLLSEQWTADPTDGVPVLADISYGRLLEGWQALQCSPGYTGMLCGTCDTNFTDLSGMLLTHY
ncbi:hypothetical protein OEZ86_007463 [Tetradesmus obliquus]|nr:hypothetical protein OEZ86_007463 [Tetradesmus obliquus]